jgi:hypothetical protein
MDCKHFGHLFMLGLLIPHLQKCKKCLKKVENFALFTQGGNWEGGTGQGWGVASSFIWSGSSYASKMATQLALFLALGAFKKCIFTVEKKKLKSGVELL